MNNTSEDMDFFPINAFPLAGPNCHVVGIIPL